MIESVMEQRVVCLEGPNVHRIDKESSRALSAVGLGQVYSNETAGTMN